MKTETLKEQFNKLHFPIDKDTGWDFIQKALKETRKKWYEAGYDIGYIDGTKKAINAMLVEERDKREHNELFNKGIMNKTSINENCIISENVGFNQCCALQQKKSQEILNKLK